MTTLVDVSGNTVVVNIEEKYKYYFDDPQSHIQTIIKQMKLEDFYFSHLKNKKDLVIFDIGANVGLVSLYMASCAKVIYSLEPSDLQHEILKSVTKDYQNIKPLKYALNDKTEDLTFYINPGNNTINSTVNNNVESKKITVKGITLVDLIKECDVEKVDFCKIDIEGSEMKALTDDILNEVYDKIDMIFIEVHSTNAPAGVNWERVLMDNVRTLHAKFRKAGYKCICPTVDGNVLLHHNNFDKIICFKDSN